MGSGEDAAERELAGRARAIIDANRYMTLGTTEADGRPRVSPVWFTHVGYRDFYWVSSPDAHHSVNVAARRDVAIVIFDSSVPVGHGQAVYLSARAAMVPADELAARCAEAFADVGPDATRFAPHEVGPGSDIRLYRAEASGHEIHIRGGDPEYGTGIDTRRAVRL